MSTAVFASFHLSFEPVSRVRVEVAIPSTSSSQFQETLDNTQLSKCTQSHPVSRCLDNTLTLSIYHPPPPSPPPPSPPSLSPLGVVYHTDKRFRFCKQPPHLAATQSFVALSVVSSRGALKGLMETKCLHDRRHTWQPC
ncbi:hypothetical protein E2C01_014433 [Portunus trituberculatus]|uniref:Uncharacterized protein n=1 Tax=Portunus trituberculatus TaxID=210409 RepID=A0A5B7DK08_PORTR|nr:hypothetical protein [Portunus trituberculatus]